MLSLVNQNKQHARKHTATFLLHIQRLHDITKPFWIHQYLYLFHGNRSWEKR